MHKAARLGKSLLILLVTTSSLVAADFTAPGWHHDAKQAWQLAREQQRPMLLYFTMSGCVYCRKMEHVTLADASVARDIRDRFVAVHVTAEQNASLIRSLKVRSFPTTVIISPRAGVIDHISGYVTPEQLRSRLQAALHRETASTSTPTQTR